MVRDQEAGGSNPPAPTAKRDSDESLFVFWRFLFLNAYLPASLLFVTELRLFYCNLFSESPFTTTEQGKPNVEFLQPFKDVAPFLQHPLVLIGFAIMLFFGILTVLLKTGILPQLSKKAAAELTKRAVNFGFVIALLVIALGFWQHTRNPEVAHIEQEKPALGDADHSQPKEEKTSEALQKDTIPKEHHRITLHIPSDLTNADITVDGKPADVVEEGLTFVVLRMEERASGQRSY